MNQTLSNDLSPEYFTDEFMHEFRLGLWAKLCDDWQRIVETVEARLVMNEDYQIAKQHAVDHKSYCEQILARLRSAN